MWSLIKLLVTAAFLGAVAYAGFFADLGGQSLASHLSEVWRTPVVQQKVGRLRQGVQENISLRLTNATATADANASKLKRAPVGDDLSDADRRALNDLLRAADAEARR